MENEKLLEISNLSVEYRSGVTTAKAINNIDLTIYRGEALGLVGESGAGKTTMALSILNLLPKKVGYITGGDIRFRNESMLKKSSKELKSIRGKYIGIVFANPLTSLNPVFTVGHQVAMALREHYKISKKEAQERAGKLLATVGIRSERMNDYPHQFSGGMRQRVGIAAALACSPELILLDEPTTALDVTIQAQIIELIKELQESQKTSLLMITHNLGIVAELCQRVAIMYGGEIVEVGTVREVFKEPKHWYTSGLLNAIPKLSGPREKLEAIPGMVANAANLPEGCKFHERCAGCTEQCKTSIPPMRLISGEHYVSCWNVRNSSREVNNA